MYFEAGVMIHSGFCASNEPKFELARYLGECRDNEENLRSMFSEILAGTGVKASGTDVLKRNADSLCCAAENDVFASLPQDSLLGELEMGY